MSNCHLPCQGTEAECLAVKKERDALRTLVGELVDEAEDAWSQCSDYMRDKHRDGDLIARARQATEADSAPSQ